MAINVISNFMLALALCALFQITTTQATSSITEKFNKCENEFWFKNPSHFKQSLKSKCLKENHQNYQKRHRQHHFCVNKSYDNEEILSKWEKFSDCRCESALFEMSNFKESNHFVCYQIAQFNKVTGEFLGELTVLNNESTGDNSVAVKFSHELKLLNDDQWSNYENGFYHSTKGPQSTSHNGEILIEKFYINGKISKSDSMSKVTLDTISPSEFLLADKQLNKNHEVAIIPLSKFILNESYMNKNKKPTNGDPTQPSNNDGTTPGTPTNGDGTTPGTTNNDGTTPGTNNNDGTTPGTNNNDGTTPGTNNDGTTPGTPTNNDGTTPGTPNNNDGTTPGTSTNGDPQPGTTPGTPANGDPQPQPGAAPGTPANGDPQPGTAPGTPANGDPQPGAAPGTPANGDPQPGTAPGTPANGDPQPGTTPGTPANGDPQPQPGAAPGTPANGDPQPGTPANGDPQPQPGAAPGTPANGDPQPGTTPGTPANGDPQPGTPTNGDPQPTTDDGQTDNVTVNDGQTNNGQTNDGTTSASPTTTNDSPNSSPNSEQVEANSDTQNNMPGTTMSTSVGLIVFGCVVTVGAAFIGFNTYERLRWRRHYRNRQAALANVPDYNGYGRAY